MDLELPENFTIYNNNKYCFKYNKKNMFFLFLLTYPRNAFFSMSLKEKSVHIIPKHAYSNIPTSNVP
jgi:hypothetical protein